ncbi:M14 family zinc carboxypeptidase [Agromyces intestinalis]|uniref:M14 family zinc carboxypeptidase n=1 Tax=Agromyces intestinalis TaxID=2592652 RepID=UPI001AEFD912|nr:M14 family zinc carboxypeptidase [Agromyces intestinalis]
MSAFRRRRVLGGAAVSAAVAGLLLTTLSPIGPAAGSEELPELMRNADEDVSVVEVTVADRTELDRLVATGVDLDHGVDVNEDGTFTVDAIVTPSEVEALEARGFSIGGVLYTEQDTEARIAEREAVRSEAIEQLQTFQAEVADDGVSDVEILRADYYTSFGVGYLSVEARYADGQANTAPLVVERDNGPGTEIGSGGTQNITRFVDASVYIKHRGATAVETRPDQVRIVSPTGDVAVATVRDWLPISSDPVFGAGFQTDFISSYLTPTELYDRIESLQAEFPQISEIVELPYKTNGYRRLAQGLLGTANASRVGLDSTAWGHEGGNDLVVTAVDPGAANAPLSVSVAGSTVTVSLATDASGAVTSTAAQVVAALNASPAAAELVTAYTYRGNAGTGVVAPGSVALTDGLLAPDTVSRDPHPVYAIRIGAVRDGSKPGVLAYAQEHAREWVPPLVTIETAERLLRNYATNAKVREIVNNLDIWIIPSTNPDGGHYSFYDFASQRRNMTNHCPITGNADALARNTWGVDVNRNYDEYSLFDGYSGASASCTGDTYAGPSELSEPESRNIDWIAANNPKITFAMNLHSSGNYFMWAPGAYKVPGRETAPRPSAEDEAYFWEAAERILTEIKRFRGMSVTPARTGPVADVLYSAAGNSGDMLWYKYGIYAWDFEVGTQFQPPFESSNPTGASAHAESQEFANGMLELMRIALDRSKGEDTAKPVIELTGDPSATLDGNEHSLVLEARDAETGLDVVVGNLYKDGALYKSTQLKADGAGQATHTIDLSTVVSGGLPLGDYTLRYNARDLAGNLSQTKQFAFTVTDLTKPKVTLVSPTTAGPFQKLQVQVDATDNHGLQRIVANIYQDGVLVKSTQSAVGGAKSGTHSATVTLPDGDYTVKYNAQDLKGLISQTSTFAFTIDATVPTVTVKGGPNETVGSDGVYSLVSFKLSDAGKIDKLTLNGVEKDLTDNAWSDLNFVRPGIFGAVAGENTLVVFDVAGNAKTLTFTLN